jgi:lipopolysaccharide biosynthesis glycosyltransferase
MKTAIVSLATHDYLYGAETLFFTLKKHNDLNGIDLYCITDPAGPPSVLLSRLGVKPVTYSGNLEGIQTSESVPHFKETTKKFLPFRFHEVGDYDRVLFFDADMIIRGSIAPLLSEQMDAKCFWAARDHGCLHYRAEGLKRAGLDPERTINSGVLVINRPMLSAGTFEHLVHGSMTDLISYDGSDQGYLNAYLKVFAIDFGLLDVRYNYALDAYYPPIAASDIVTVHFTGTKPWRAQPGAFGPYDLFYAEWWQARRELEASSLA